MNIKQHKYDIPFLTERAKTSEEKHLPIHKKFLNDDMDRLQSFAEDCKIISIYYSVIDFEIKKASTYFLLGMRSLATYFRLALLPKGTIEKVVLNDEWSFEIESRPTKSYTDCSTWTSTLMQAIIARDKALIDSLLEFPTERMREADLKGQEYEYLYTIFLKAYLQKEKNMGELLVQAYKATDPKNLPEYAVDTMFDRDLPIFDVWIAFLNNKENEFNQRLERALELNKKFVSDDAKTIYTLVNYELTALAALAHDRGWQITVTSGYMPEWMIWGEFT